jgi:ribosomal protein S18 acetylase RimI-like enzyme
MSIHKETRMVAVTLRPVSEVDFGDFTSAFNRAYQDYFVPIEMTAPAFRSLMQRDDLVLTESVAALDGPIIVGTGLLGIRNDTGWIGGMGVVPEYRRQGLGRQMMHYLIDRARLCHLTRIDLEVIEANKAAYRLYQEIGFVDTRFLLILERPPGLVPEPSPRFDVQECPAESLLHLYPDFHDVPNCWQRSLPSLRGLAPHTQGWKVLDDEQIVGYAVGWANEHAVRLIDIASQPGPDRLGITTALLAHLHRNNPDAPGSSYNIAEDDPALPANQAMGYTTSFRQIEMRLVLDETAQAHL